MSSIASRLRSARRKPAPPIADCECVCATGPRSHGNTGRRYAGLRESECGCLALLSPTKVGRRIRTTADARGSQAGKRGRRSEHNSAKARRGKADACISTRSSVRGTGCDRVLACLPACLPACLTHGASPVPVPAAAPRPDNLPWPCSSKRYQAKHATQSVIRTDTPTHRRPSHPPLPFHPPA